MISSVSDMSVDKFKCNSFVFLDLETTGLPFKEADGGKTKITEISLISISRDVLSKVHSDIPRCLPKLTLIMNPLKRMPTNICQITGLDNEMLDNEDPFNEKKAAAIKCFLDQCKPPICLVAHNGYRFDFRMLKEELIPFPDIIPENTRCADTLLAFRELIHRPEVDERTYQFNPFINDVDLQLIKASEDTEKKSAMKLTDETMISNINMTLKQIQNETTPPSQKMNSGRILFLDNHKRRLEFENSKPKNLGFKLCDVYERIFGVAPPNGHRAEDDTIAMIKCCLRFGTTIVDHFDRNSHLYSTIDRMYLDGKTNL